MDIAEVLKSFEVYDGVYKREQVQFAVDNQDEITPHLLSILKEVSDDPLKYSAIENYHAHIYALILLGYFRETEAHEMILKLLSYSDEICYSLFGDILNENFPIVLFQTCGGSVAKIKEFILKKENADYHRVAAISSLVYAVADDIVSREEVLKLLRSQFTGDEVDDVSDYWGLVASDICELCPDAETLEIMNRSYEIGLISPRIIGPEDFDKAMDLGVSRSLEIIREKMSREMPEDIHQSMSWWACFRADEYNVGFNSKSSANFPRRKKKKKVKSKAYTQKKMKKKRRK